jgi:hypothetical protein
MPKFHNTSRHQTYDFIKPGGKMKNGVRETVSFAPGEERDEDLDVSVPEVAAALKFGELRSTGSVEQRATAAIATEEPQRGRK